MLLLVVLKTLVEELDVARDVLLIDEATRERLTLVIDRHVERLCEVAKLRLLQVRPPDFVIASPKNPHQRV